MDSNLCNNQRNLILIACEDQIWSVFGLQPSLELFQTVDVFIEKWHYLSYECLDFFYFVGAAYATERF